MKRLWLVALLLMMAVLLAACGFVIVEDSESVIIGMRFFYRKAHETAIVLATNSFRIVSNR